MMKSDFEESENFTQQCSGEAPATSTSAASTLGDLRLLLVGPSLEPVDVDERHRVRPAL